MLYRSCCTLVFICLLTFSASAQKLLAVLNLVTDGSVPQKNLTIISDTISAAVARDSTYVQFDRAMLPDLLKQLMLDESSISCSDPQCLTIVGGLIGAEMMIGGMIKYANHATTIELNLVDVAERKAINSVSLSSGAKKSTLLGSEIPALVQSLLSAPNSSPQAVVPPAQQNPSILKNPLLYVGTFLATGAAAGAYYYKYHYRADDGGDPDPVDPPIVNDSPGLSMDDVPVRKR